eukprot:808844-Ditylum_brightwellii.AAC.1
MEVGKTMSGRNHLDQKHKESFDVFVNAVETKKKGGQKRKPPMTLFSPQNDFVKKQKLLVSNEQHKKEVCKELDHQVLIFIDNSALPDRIVENAAFCSMI